MFHLSNFLVDFDTFSFIDASSADAHLDSVKDGS